jgi:DNA-binding PadR family transcriptional regulator
MKIDKSLLSGSNSMLVLELLQTEDMYGYQMIESLEKRSKNVFELKAGTLYPLLHGLEQQGAVESYEVPEEGVRPRRYYHLTKAGKRLLSEKKAEWNIFSTAVNQVIGGPSYASV